MRKQLWPSLLRCPCNSPLKHKNTGATSTNQARAPARRAFTGAGRDYKAYPPEILENGHKLFLQHCAFCHGANAKGGETGPDLLRSVIVLDDDNDEKIGQAVPNGRPDKGMPKIQHDTGADFRDRGFLT